MRLLTINILIHDLIDDDSVDEMIKAARREGARFLGFELAIRGDEACELSDQVAKMVGYSIQELPKL